MRKPKLLSFCLVLAAALAATQALAKEELAMPKDLPPYGAEKPLPVPAIDVSTLANGLTVWLVPRPGFPKVSAVLAVRGGDAADPQDLLCMADVLGDALKEGTAKRTSKQIAEELQAVGGEVSVNVTDDAVLVTIDGLASGRAILLDVLADLARNAAFPEKEVELAKANALQGLLARESTPEFQADKAFAAAVFGDHPYRAVAATKETIEKITPELLRKEYARRFRPDGSLLVIAGAFDAKVVGAEVGKLLGGWKAAGEGVPATAPAPGAGARKILLVDRSGSVQSEIRVGRPTVKATDADYYRLQVANTIFGGAFSSRLVENIREDKGYTYSPRSQARTFAQGGMLWIRAAVRTDVTAATLLEIFYELDRMGATLPTADEMTRAKRLQSGLYLLRNETNGALAGTLATFWVNGLPPAALGEFVTRVNEVTPEQVREVGKRLMTSASQTVVVGGDANKVAADIEIFGTPSAAKP